MHAARWLVLAFATSAAVLAARMHTGYGEPGPAKLMLPKPTAPAAPSGHSSADAALAPSPSPAPLPSPSFDVIEAGSDRPLRVLAAAQPGPRALVYLHGYCGDVNAALAFARAAAAHGTLIALLGDQPCKDKPGRFKWSHDAHALDARIRRAVGLVNRAERLQLDESDITLFGYSQGAARAEDLARYYGKRYPRVILGGPPQRAKPEHFRLARAIAIFGGELEDTQDMLGGADDLAARGMLARFFLLPGVDHGDFGGETSANQAITSILSFVSDPRGAVPPGQRALAAD